MKMIRAIVRPEKETDAIKALEAVGFGALTKWDVLGRGRQKGIFNKYFPISTYSLSQAGIRFIF